MEEYINRALLDYKELENIIISHKDNFEKLCEILNGFNKNEEYFDVNFKSITTTIYNKNNKIILCENIDIWEDENAYPTKEMFNIKEYEREEN